MGLLDSMTSAVNKGAAAAGRTSRSAKLKLQQNELLKQRRELAAQLGASLYDAVKEMPELREGRESLLDSIAELDSQRAEIEKEIAAIEEEAQVAQSASMSYQCPRCGTRVSEAHSFCAGCGMPIAEVKAAYGADKQAANESEAFSGIRCASCGAPMEEGDLFCMACGAKVEAPSEAAGDAEDESKGEQGSEA